MLDAIISGAAEAVFSYIPDKLEPAERLRDWLKRSPAKLAYQHALAQTNSTKRRLLVNAKYQSTASGSTFHYH